MSKFNSKEVETLIKTVEKTLKELNKTMQKLEKLNVAIKENKVNLEKMRDSEIQITKSKNEQPP